MNVASMRQRKPALSVAAIDQSEHENQRIGAKQRVLDTSGCVGTRANTKSGAQCSDVVKMPKVSTAEQASAPCPEKTLSIGLELLLSMGITESDPLRPYIGKHAREAAAVAASVNSLNSSSKADNEQNLP